MADPQTEQLLQALGQLGAASINSRSGMTALNQSMARLRSEMQRGTGTVQSNSAALQNLNSSFSALDTAARQSTQGMSMLREAQSMAAKVTADAAGQMSAGLLKGGLVEAVQSVSNQLLSTTQAYQSGASGLDTVIASQNASIESQIRILDKMTAGATTVAEVFALIPNPIARAVAGISGLAAGALGAASGLTDLEKQHIQVLQKELQNTTASFSLMEKNGAALAGGFTAMRDTAGDAQLYQEEFSKVVVRNKKDLMDFGNTVAGGVKKFKNVNIELTNLAKQGKDYRKELTMAGYSAEDQAEGLIQYMEMLNKSGQLRNMSDREVAVGHAEYMKNLRAVSMFTGEDAKQAQKRAQQAAEQLAVQAKLAEQGPGAVERFTTAVASMGPEIQKGLQQMTATDGTIIDKNLNQLLAASPTRKKLLEETYADMQNSALDATEVNKRYQERVKEYGAAMKEEALAAGKSYGQLTLLTGAQSEVTGLFEKQAELGRKGESAKDRETAQLGDTTVQLQKLMTDGIDPTRSQMVGLERVMRENLRPQMSQLTEQMSLYSQSMAQGKGIAEAQRKQNELDLQNRKTLMDAVLKYNITAEPGGKINEATSKVTNVLLSTVEKLQQAASNLATFTKDILKIKIPGAAKGGAFSGPTSGYLVELHGNEAVFPEKVLESLSQLQIPDPKQLFEKAASAGNAGAAPDEMKTVLDVVKTSMEGITNQLNAQNQKTDGKFDEMLQTMRDRTILEDLLSAMQTSEDYLKRIADNT
jgi:hypothetical protein